MDTYRLNFIDIDQSFNIPVADTSVKGYMVVRAPKGTAEPMYFSRGQAAEIHSMLGVPTAAWQDLQDAIDFNNQFGLWISAPAGTSKDYPTTYGGSYITSRGVYPFYQVADKKEPNYRVLVVVGREKESYLHDEGEDASIEAIVSEATDKIAITSIHPQILAAADGLRLDFWGNPNFGANPGEAVYELQLHGSRVVAEDPDGNEVEVGELDGDTLTLFGTKASGEGTFLAMTFADLIDPAPYLTDSGDFKLPQEDAMYNENTYKEAIAAEVASRLEWTLNIEDDTYMVITQKSPNEKETKVTITDIGYDKYFYDLSLSVYKNEFLLDGRPSPYPSISDVANTEGLYLVFNDDDAYGTSGIYKSKGDSFPPENVTEKYRTRYIRVRGAGIVRDSGGNIIEVDGNNPEAVETAEYIDSLYFVTANGMLMKAEEGGAIEPKLNPKFNTITFSVEEEVYPGQMQSGGSFHGSLSETGRDSYGAKIYFHDILPDDASSFIEVDVKRVFDANVADSGFYQGVRLVDKHEGVSTLSTELQGQRYISKVNADLIASGTTGGAPVPEYTPILLEGWQEAAKSAYDPVGVFMEPTGIETLKENLYAIRQSSHKMATLISGKKITEAEKSDVESIIVVGRSTGTAQYVNEFLRKDSYTGKKYWSNLIGAIGTKLARIQADKMGGWAPMFTDVGGLGGQLPINVEKARFEFDPEEQQILDEKGLNPVVLDPSYGLMIISQKTTQDPDSLSDWSYLGHSMAFDLFKKEIRDNVMIPQIGKPNDPFYQDMRQQQASAILARRTGGARPIWAAGKVEVANVNTDEIRAQRKFKIKITVKVNVFSEYVELEFVNVAQTTSV